MALREDCRLRNLAQRDLPRVLEWRNSDRVRANMYTDNVITWEEHCAWYKTLKRKKDAVYLVFEYKGNPAGMVYFTAIEKRNNKCFMGFYLGEENLPKGTGIAMGYLGLEYTFEKLGIRKVCGEVLGFNIPSIKFFGKLGFAIEGKFVRHVLKNGVFTDVVAFALFRKDWDENKDNLKAFVFK